MQKTGSALNRRARNEKIVFFSSLAFFTHKIQRFQTYFSFPEFPIQTHAVILDSDQKPKRQYNHSDWGKVRGSR